MSDLAVHTLALEICHHWTNFLASFKHLTLLFFFGSNTRKAVGNIPFSFQGGLLQDGPAAGALRLPDARLPGTAHGLLPHGLRIQDLPLLPGLQVREKNWIYAEREREIREREEICR